MQGYHFLTYKQTVDLFRKSGYNVIETIHKSIRIANVPELGDRVIAATSKGINGKNPFFLIPADIKNEVEAQKYVFRFACGLRDWTGPEGVGWMSLYHDHRPLTFENNWFVQEQLNIPHLRAVQDKSEYVVNTHGEMHLENRMIDQKIDVGVEKRTQLLYDQDQIHLLRGMDIKGTSLVGMDRKVTYTNIGDKVWGEDNGYLFIWTMAMMGCDDQTKIYLPHKGRDETMVEDFKFNDGKEIPNKMRKKLSGVDIIDANGQERWKVGIGGEGTKGIVMSYMPSIETLAILTFGFNPEGDYLDGRWTQEPITTGGQALCAYNNDETIPILPGRFHELEAISERLEGGKGSSGTLSSRLIFVTGSKDKLEKIVQKGAENPRIRLVA